MSNQAQSGAAKIKKKNTEITRDTCTLSIITHGTHNINCTRIHNIISMIHMWTIIKYNYGGETNQLNKIDYSCEQVSNHYNRLEWKMKNPSVYEILEINSACQNCIMTQNMFCFVSIFYGFKKKSTLIAH